MTAEECARENKIIELQTKLFEVSKEAVMTEQLVYLAENPKAGSNRYYVDKDLKHRKDKLKELNIKKAEILAEIKKIKEPK